MISHWSFPKDEKRLPQFAKAGFNTVIATPGELQACREHGWRAILAAPEDEAAKYLEDPIVWGYFVFDEPALKKVPYNTFVKRMEAFHGLDPKRPAYINLNEKDDPEAFIKTLKPRVLSYDYYQWWAKPEPFFPLLEKFRAAALAADIPLLCWVEAVAAAHGPPPADNEAKIRHSVYSALAYGAKGIQWWAWRPESPDCAKINAELKVLGLTLITLHSTDVFHTGPLPPQTRPVPEKFWVQSSTPSLLLGVFQNKEKQDFLLVANRDWQHDHGAELVFDSSITTIATLDKASGKWTDAKLVAKDDRKTLTLPLAKGDGILLRVSNK